MRALYYDRYGGTELLSVRELPRPVVGPAEVLVRVRAAALNRSDWENLRGSPAYARLAGGLLRPRRRVLGSDFAGEVVEVGANVERFAPGDRVFGDTMYRGGPTFAEYTSVPEDATISHLPDGLSFTQASALPQAGTIAMQGLAGVGPGARVLIVGGGGATGLFAIQLAALAGARVTASDSAAKLGTMRALGAEDVFDYRTSALRDSGQRFDYILDPVAGLSVSSALELLAEGGRYQVVGGPVGRLLPAALAGLVYRPGGRRLAILFVQPGLAALERLAELAVQGELHVPVERTYGLEELPEALRLLGAGGAVGRLVLEPGEGAGA